MLDFLMNPSFNNTLLSNPWWIMLMAIIKMVLIAVGSLIVASLFLLAAVVIYKGSRRIHRYMVSQCFTRLSKLKAEDSSFWLPPSSDQKYPHRDLPHLAA